MYNSSTPTRLLLYSSELFLHAKLSLIKQLFRNSGIRDKLIRGKVRPYLSISIL